MSTSKGRLLSTILFPEQMVFKYDEELPIAVGMLLCYSLVCFALSLLFQVSTLIAFPVSPFHNVNTNRASVVFELIYGTRAVICAVPNRATKQLDYKMELLHCHNQSDRVAVASSCSRNWANLCIWTSQGEVYRLPALIASSFCSVRCYST